MQRIFQWTWPAIFRRTSPAAPSQPRAPLSVYKFEGGNFVFGLDWRLVPPNRRLTRVMALARQEGQAWCALSEMEDVVGFLAAPQWLREPHYSASLHLASRYSQGGLELFAFELPSQQCLVLALQESRPLPGFDFLGDAVTARALVDEFLEIQRGQPMRLVGNLQDLDGQEQASPEDLFLEPLKSTRLRSLRSWRAVQRGLVFVALAVAIGLGGSWTLEQRRQQTLAQLHASPAYQQNLYQEGLRAAWATVPAPVNVVLRSWHDLLGKLPLRLRGWRLSHVECNLGQCLAHWQRQYGSYADLMAHLPADATGVDEAASDQDLMSGKLVTRHVLSMPASDEEFARHELPDLRIARRTLADRLQDLQLLGRTLTRVEPAQLFGGQLDPETLVEPVFSGNWSLRHAIWVLPTLSLPDFVRVQTLKVDLLATQTRSERGAVPEAGKVRDDSEEAPSEPYFEITGTYYAQK